MKTYYIESQDLFVIAITAHLLIGQEVKEKMRKQLGKQGISKVIFVEGDFCYIPKNKSYLDLIKQEYQEGLMSQSEYEEHRDDFLELIKKAEVKGVE